MGTKVYTDSICDRCGKQDKRDDVEGASPPVNWAIVFSLHIREAGSGWKPGGQNTRVTLCPDCIQTIEKCLLGENHDQKSQ